MKSAPRITYQQLMATWRASRRTFEGSPPAVIMKIGALPRGLMIGSSVRGTTRRAWTSFSRGAVIAVIVRSALAVEAAGGLDIPCPAAEPEVPSRGDAATRARPPGRVGF